MISPDTSDVLGKTSEGRASCDRILKADGTDGTDGTDGAIDRKSFPFCGLL